MEARVGWTVNFVEPMMPLIVAWMVVDPETTLVASPFEPVLLLIVATPELDELHVTEVVMSWILKSE
jgi:hypothetical protein